DPARKIIVDQAVTLISEVYAHLRLKEATEAVDPVQDLRLLGLRELASMTELEFHAELSEILTSLRDAHTVYLAPGAENQRAAFIPLLIEQCDGDQYLVTKIATGVDARGLEPGSVISHWNGRPIADYAESAADLTPGANPAARHARAVARLTCRWIGNGILP